MRKLSATLLLLVAATLALASAAETHDYTATLTAQINPETASAALTLTVSQPKHYLRELSFRAPKAQFSHFSTEDGDLSHEDDRLIWDMPSHGGSIHWTASLNVPRGDSWDARTTNDWSLFRFEDLLPPLRSTTLKGSSNSFKLLLDLPKGWTAETRYGRYTGKPLEVGSDQQNFRRPTGWLIAGHLGVRRDTISERDIAVAAPIGTGFPRVPVLALLNWTLPDFVQVFPTTPERVLIVSGDRTMWRGALSGPDSLYLHLERPLISENGTSTVLHEMVHVATRWSAAPGDDWIVEGLAEYYSLEILHRSGGLSDARFAAAKRRLTQWSEEENGSLQDPSKGSDTAFAAILFADIAHEIGSAKLDAVVRHLTGTGGPKVISRAELMACIEAVVGKPSKILTTALHSGTPN